MWHCAFSVVPGRRSLLDAGLRISRQSLLSTGIRYFRSRRIAAAPITGTQDEQSDVRAIHMGALHVNNVLGNTTADSALVSLAKGEDARRALASRIAKAVLTFQNQLLDRDANTGSLCQVNHCLTVDNISIQSSDSPGAMRMAQSAPQSIF